MELSRSSTGGRRPLQPSTEARGERRRTAGTERAERACWPYPCIQHGPQKAFRRYIRFVSTQFSVPARIHRPKRRLDRTKCQQRATPTTAPTTAPTSNHPQRTRTASPRQLRQLHTTPIPSISSRSHQLTAAALGGAGRPKTSRRSLSIATGAAWSARPTCHASLSGKRGDIVRCFTTPLSHDYEPPTHIQNSCLSDTYKLHIGFKRDSRQGHGRTNAKLSTKGLREGRGGQFHPKGLDTYAFSRHRCKSTAVAIAAGVCIGADVGQRRALCEVRQTMILYNQIYESEAQPDAGTEGEIR